MDAYRFDWLKLLLRWAHVIVAIAWIGSLFYFVFLDNSLTKWVSTLRRSLTGRTPPAALG